jgi:lipopolysaccharide/colanic/teichoic acid biosynthesis glycosyltransferase
LPTINREVVMPIPKVPACVTTLVSRGSGGESTGDQVRKPVAAPGVLISPRSSWPDSRAKRLIDFIGAVVLLVPALPLMAIVAVVVRLTSPGPVFFRQIRCGKGGYSFHLLKFRSMRHEQNHSGPGLTSSNDTRVTPVGRVIRRWKLDELPQLLNVISGEMSLVGPRPDLPEYLDALPAAQRQVLHLKPGITSIATIRFRNEAEVLSTVPAESLIDYYIANVLPRKANMEMDYASQASLVTDLAVLLRTVGAIFQ